MSTAKKYLIAIGMGLGMTAVVAYSQGIFTATRPSVIFQILTDSFFVPAVLLLGAGGLAFVSNEGGFDALAYGITSFADLFRKEKKNKYKTFYDYKTEKAEKTLPVSFLLITGLIFMGIMALMYWLYTQYI